MSVFQLTIRTIYWIFITVSCWLLSSTTYALNEINDNELSGISGQGDSIAMVLEDFAVNPYKTDDGKVGINIDEFPSDDLVLSEFWLTKSGGGGANIGTTLDPIILGELFTAVNGNEVIRFAFPTQEESMDLLSMSVLLTNEVYPDHLLRVTLDKFKPTVYRRSIDGKTKLSEVPTAISLWSEEKYGLSITGNIALKSNKISLQSNISNAPKGEFILNDVELLLPLGNDSQSKQGFHIITNLNGDKYFFRLLLESLNGQNPSAPPGFLRVHSMTVPDKNGVRVLKPNNNNHDFISIYGLQMQSMRFDAFSP